MKSHNYLIILYTSFILLGCNPDNSAKTKLLEEERAALKKAKEVEKTILQQSQQIQQNADNQTR